MMVLVLVCEFEVLVCIILCDIDEFLVVGVLVYVECGCSGGFWLCEGFVIWFNGLFGDEV